MKKDLSGALLAGMIVLMASPMALPDEALARRGGGFSRSFGSRSRAMSFGRSPRSSRTSRWGSARQGGYQRKGGLFGNRRSKRGGAFQKGKRPMSATRAPTRNARGHRMLGRRTGAATRSQRASAMRQRHSRPTTVINNRFYGGRGWGTWGPGMYSVGVWDLFFLSTVSHMFWYHHWHDPGIQRALRQENLLQDQELARLEAKVKALEAKGIARDPNYLPAEVDPDLAYSKTYVDKAQTEFYAEEPPAVASDGADSGAQDESANGLFMLFGLTGLAMLFYGLFIRRW